MFIFYGFLFLSIQKYIILTSEISPVVQKTPNRQRVCRHTNQDYTYKTYVGDHLVGYFNKNKKNT